MFIQIREERVQAPTGKCEGNADIGKHPDAGKDWGQEEKGTTED